MHNRQTTTSPQEACLTPAASLPPQPPILDPVQRTWDASRPTDRAIYLHAFGISCSLAANIWDELHYTVQIVLRAHIRRFLKLGRIAERLPS
jgi:hypothetical protein